jgi:hypothetical protein
VLGGIQAPTLFILANNSVFLPADLKSGKQIIEIFSKDYLSGVKVGKN